MLACECVSVYFLLSRKLPLIFCCDFSEGLVEPFAEPVRQLKKKNKKKSKAGKVHPRALNFEMREEASMWNTRRTAPTVSTQPITKPNLETEIKGQFLHMVKELTYDGKSDINPIVHIESFEEICDLFRTENNRDAIRLWLFPFTLAWLRSLEPSSIATWEDIRSKFLSRFFPPSKIEKLRAEIRSFRQEDEETISEAWERFKHLLNSCPSHRLNKSDQVQTFYSGLNYSFRGTLDSSADGVFMYKTPTQGYTLLEDMLIHNIDWKSDKRLHIPKLAGKISINFDPSEELAAMKNKQVRFERKIDDPIKTIHALQVGCEECKGPHLTKDCPNKPMMTPEVVNFLNQGDYQGRWNNNRNFNQRPPRFFAPNHQNQRMDGEPHIGRTQGELPTHKLKSIQRGATYTNSIWGNEFMAQDMTFRNTVGPDAGQVVAFFSDSDRSAFYHCSFEGYQDTLYAYGKRQFYKECQIFGTVDFIFGNALAFFQDCEIFLRKPLVGGGLVVTAQGRAKENEASGFSLQGCKITAGEDLKPVLSQYNKAFLGRPWRPQALTVYMENYFDDLVDPQGWLDTWGFNETCFPGEYNNYGPGSSTLRRVKWPSFHNITDQETAEPYTVAQFFQGDNWVAETGVPYIPGFENNQHKIKY
ncbi:hypothetical protein OSB04_008177 [Centaurea solstitialis]|uniref:Pectinesterase n=1 Tax=Centaurea solstitialis TaxID=347529 RepID=A0AA38WJ79_9ASTR|nr:hypothetical protein OSB04_008177 [Centaurea solstitialis]